MKDKGKSEGGGEFQSFFAYLMLFFFLFLFWGGFKADMARRDGVKNVAQYKQAVYPVQQKVYKRSYVNYGSGPATVYYIQR